jgi:long-chain acyl-CoA synthetase
MLEWLFARFKGAVDRTAMIWRDQPFGYNWLLAHVQAWKDVLEKESVTSGTVVALEGDYSPRVVALLLALIDQGCIIVPLTNTVESRKPRFKEVAEVQKSFIFTDLDAWRLESYPMQVQHPLNKQLQETGHPGLVLFSSGSTGEPKAALHDFSKLLDKFLVQRHTLRAITFLLLDHIGGVNTLLYVLSNAGAIISIEDRSPDAVCAAIQKHRVELLPTSPTFLNMLLLSEGYRRYDLSSLQRITYGTEPMPESTLKRISQVFPKVTIQQTYGLSELGILRSKSRSNDTLWVKVGGEGYQTKVIDNILWIKADSAMLGYLNAPSPFDADGWFNTGDEVEVDGEYLKILGRRSELINVGGEKVYPAEVESLLMQLDNIEDASVRGEPNPITGQMVVARVTLAHPEDLIELRKRVRTALKELAAPYKIPAKIELAENPLHSARFKKMRRVD